MNLMLKIKNTIIVLNKIDKACDKNLKELKDFLKDEKVIEISAIKRNKFS